MNEQEMLMRKISSLRFSMWELHLFLDSHPNNCDAARFWGLSLWSSGIHPLSQTVAALFQVLSGDSA